jgi:hypothetical protein
MGQKMGRGGGEGRTTRFLLGSVCVTHLQEVLATPLDTPGPDPTCSGLAEA